MPRNPYLDQVPKQEFPLTSYYLQSKLSAAGGSSSISASYADTASYAVTASYADTASHALNASAFPYVGNALITGSLGITGSLIVKDNIDSIIGTLSSDQISLNWKNRNLYDTDGALSINWNSGLNIIKGPLKITSGSNTVVGTEKLSSGSVIVYNTLVTAESIIFLSIQETGTGMPGILHITSKDVGNSFRIQSTEATDDSKFAYMIVN
jgi:hypothetical protein